MAGEILALSATLSFVASNILFRKCDHDVSPIFINAFRTLIGVFTFIIIAWFSGIFSSIFLLSWELWLLLILSFIFGQVIGDTSYFTAQKELGPTKALAISMTYPLFSFILSLIFLNETFNWWIILSFLFISAGVFFIAREQMKIQTENTKLKTSSKKSKKKTFLAVLFAFLASLGWAAGLVIIDFATNKINDQLNLGAYSSILGNVIRFPAAFLILTTLLYSTEKKPLRNISKTSYGWLIAASLIGTSLGAFLYTEAARVAGATIMSLMASANPLFSIPLAYLINKEKITKTTFFGVILIMIGVMIIIVR
ncbi:MAG: DMT family transporter [Candidatus Lokiarchaeota archaeon]|nr:DMT family transporter [Candidatus Harpocratesius repetitus]